MQLPSCGATVGLDSRTEGHLPQHGPRSSIASCVPTVWWGLTEPCSIHHACSTPRRPCSTLLVLPTVDHVLTVMHAMYAAQPFCNPTHVNHLCLPCSGHFHEYPGTPTANNNVRAAIATCDDWVPAQSAISKVVTKEAALNPSNITGNGTLWVYLYKNCSDSASIGMELDVALQGSDAATPWSGFIDGFLQTGARLHGQGMGKQGAQAGRQEVLHCACCTLAHFPPSLQ